MTFEITPRDEHNTKLINNTHPENRPNPEPKALYDLVVIGAGTAGLVTASAAAGLGATVAMIERGHMGGDCLNVGCVPSKGVIRAATALADVRDADQFGIEVQGDIKFSFQTAMARMRKLRAHISDVDSVQRYSGELNVEVFLGQGAFIDANTVEVDGKKLKFRRAVIATGARAAAPPIEGLEEAGYLTNETIFNLTEQPKRMAVIGGGPIGCEMAQTFQRYGTDVTLIELADHVLIREDADAAQIVQQSLLKDGVTLALSAKKILGVEKKGKEKVVRYHCGKTDKECSVTVDEILVGVGRAPNVDGLGLEKVGVKYDTRKGVEVNDYLQTTNPMIYAAGDICFPYKFTHTADFLARIVINNALFGFGVNRQKASDLVIPWATYTDPQLAHVGITEHGAKEQGIEIDTFTQSLEHVDRAILDGETNGFVKVHVKKGTDEILGATIVARHAGDMIGEFVMAIKHKIGLGSVASVIHPYPTQSEALRRTGDLYNRSRLTPRTAKILKAIIRLKRKF